MFKNAHRAAKNFEVASAFALLIGGGRAAELSDNLSGVTTGIEKVAGDRWIAASFKTDAETTYRLSSVTLLLGNPTAGAAELALHSDGGLEPGDALATLTSPGTYSTTPAEAKFLASAVSLNPGATYWLVLKATGGEFEWAWTTDGTASGAGFDPAWDVSEDASASWFTQDLYPMQLKVSVNEDVQTASFLRGDSNEDGKLDISDPLTTLGVLFLGAAALECPDAADANDDGAIDLSDAVFTLSFEFLGGAELPAPGPSACGADPTADDLVECVYDADACKT